MKIELTELEGKEFIFYGLELHILDEMLRKVELENAFIVFFQEDNLFLKVGFEWQGDDILIVVDNAIEV